MAKEAYWGVLIGLVLVISISGLAVAQYELEIKEEREDESALVEIISPEDEPTQEEKSGLTPIKAPSDWGGVTYTPPYVPAPQELIDKVNEQIIARVGEDYFDDHIKLAVAKKSGSRYVPQNQTIEPTYIFYYNYTYDLKKGPDDVPYQVEHVFQLRVYSNGELMADGGRDPGPREPYQFLISESKARAIARENGMGDVGLEILYGRQGYNSDTPIERGTYVWSLWEDCAPKGSPWLLFIHVDTGEILGKRISGGCIELTANIVESGSPAEEESINSDSVSDKEESGIIQRMIGWIKVLFTK